MSDERKQILQMLADGKITADEADRLLAALESGAAEPEVEDRPEGSEEPAAEPGGKPKFLRIKVQSATGGHHGHENINVKIPIVLLKAGMKLTSVMPEKARSKFAAHPGDKGLGLALNQLDGENIDTLIQALAESAIDIDADDENIRIYCA